MKHADECSVRVILCGRIGALLVPRILATITWRKLDVTLLPCVHGAVAGAKTQIRARGASFLLAQYRLLNVFRAIRSTKGSRSVNILQNTVFSD